MPEPVETDSDLKPGTAIPPANYTLAAWDLDTTGRRLIDEICQIGGFCKTQAQEGSEEAKAFSQYVMPYRNPNPGARRSFGIKVVNIGKYRMLKDLDSGKILKTKSEVSALQDFISWLGEQKTPDSAGVVLLSHEPARAVLVPLLLEALLKYGLLEAFSAVVVGFCNTSTLVKQLGDKDKITSLSLRSLCKTVLQDTNLPTNSATDRCRALMSILSSVAGDSSGGIDISKVTPFTCSLSQEQTQLRKLKSMLGTQGTLRPIFESHLKAKRLVRERAMGLRRGLAEAGLNYSTLEQLARSGESDLRKKVVEAFQPHNNSDDVEEAIKLIQQHFNLSSTQPDCEEVVLSKVPEPKTVNS